MIYNVKIKHKGTELILLWNRPKYTPYRYKYRIKCRYVSADTLYLAKDVAKSFWSTFSRVENVYYGSYCTVHFVAVYNPASLDKGLQINHFTRESSE